MSFKTQNGVLSPVYSLAEFLCARATRQFFRFAQFDIDIMIVTYYKSVNIAMTVTSPPIDVLCPVGCGLRQG